MTIPNLGWIPPADRTREQREINDEIVGAMRTVMRANATPPVGTKVMLTDYWKHPATVKLLGKPFTGMHQFTGSCVLMGGWNTTFTKSIIDVVAQGQPEKLILPNCLPNYGKSRAYAGLRGRGEGSLGSTFAKSLAQDGSGDIALTSLKFDATDDGFSFGANVEMAFSDGANLPSDQLSEGKQHLYDTTVNLRSPEEIRDVILSLNPCTTAYALFVDINTPRVTQGAVVGRYNKSGGHQTSYLGYWNHPDLGELLWYHNQWGLRVYPQDPGGGPLGGCWLPFDEVRKVCNSGDGENFGVLDYKSYQILTFKWDI